MSAVPPGDVLCAVDLSEASRHAVAQAVALASVVGARVRLLRVDSRAGASDADAAALTELMDMARAEVPVSCLPRVEPMLRTGPPSAGILAAAREIGASLIVMGTRGRGALARAFVGSTATAVLAASAVPVAVVPPRLSLVPRLTPSGLQPAFGAIVVPLDLGGACVRQLAWAARLSACADRPLLAMHVVPAGQMRGSETDRARVLVEGLETAHGVRTVVREGRVVPEVIAAVRGEQAGLVVMGRSGDAPGRMAYEVLIRTDALVLVVPETARGLSA